MRPYPTDPLGSFKSVNPFMRVVYGVLGLGVMGVVLTLGAMFFVVFAAIALIGGSVLAARIWWLSRKAERALGDQFEPLRSGARRQNSDQTAGRKPSQDRGRDRGQHGEGGHQGSKGPSSVLEGEFIVVERHPKDQP